MFVKVFVDENSYTADHKRMNFTSSMYGVNEERISRIELLFAYSIVKGEGKIMKLFKGLCCKPSRYCGEK